MGLYSDVRVGVPEGKVGDWEIDRFEIGKGDFLALSYAFQGRSPGLGTFTRLCYKGNVWMSDTDAEVRDHIEAIFQLQSKSVKTVLIHGLGLGMIVGYALRQPHVEAVTVVEIDPDVISLVGAYYQQMAKSHGKTLSIVNDNALTWEPPKGQCWDVVWHDIWRDLGEDNRDQISLLNRRFGRRSKWQGAWGKEWLDRVRRRAYA